MDYVVDVIAWVTCQHGLHVLCISFGKVVGVIVLVT